MKRDKGGELRFDRQHFKETHKASLRVRGFYDLFIRAVAKEVYRHHIKPSGQGGEPIKIEGQKEAFVRAYKNHFKTLNDKVLQHIEGETKKAWQRAIEKQEVSRKALEQEVGTELFIKSKEEVRRSQGLKEFQQRKVGGMNLSQRVWQTEKMMTGQMELAIDVSLKEGKSANQLSKDIRHLLNHPDKLYRRVRDKHGHLKPSRAMQAFHPGQGVYRSAYKNAMRVARTEINMAYRTSDFHEWANNHAVIGYRVVRSNHEPKCNCKVCERLQGEYPKSFKFIGWHPQCLCYAVPILMSDDLLRKHRKARIKAIKEGRNPNDIPPPQDPREVKTLPKNYTDWVSENAHRWQGGKGKAPYFIRDNEGIAERLASVQMATEETKRGGMRAEALKILKLERGEQFKLLQSYDNGGQVLEHKLARQGEDYNDILKIAKAFAKEGRVVEIMPEINETERTIRNTIFPNLQSKRANPDLRIGNKYYDVKRPTAIKNIEGNANKASKQGAIAVISTARLNKKMEEQVLNDRVEAIFKNENYKFNVIYFFDEKKLTLFNRTGDK